MTFAQTLTIALERSNQLQTFWAFYATVVLGVLAFFGSARSGSRPKVVATLVTVGFLAVSIANLEALLDVSRQRLELQGLLVQLAGSDGVLVSMANTITPSSLFAVKAFHRVFDLFTIVSIWVMTIRG
jgi:hypothetical protein